jgi:hypothetical protein
MTEPIIELTHNLKSPKPTTIVLSRLTAILGPRGGGKTAARAAIELLSGAPVKYLGAHLVRGGGVEIKATLDNGATLSLSGMKGQTRDQRGAYDPPRLVQVDADFETRNAESLRRWLLGTFGRGFEVDLTLPVDSSAAAQAEWAAVVSAETRDEVSGAERLLAALVHFAGSKSKLTSEASSLENQHIRLVEAAGSFIPLATATQDLFAAIIAEHERKLESARARIAEFEALPALTPGHVLAAIGEEYFDSRPHDTCACPMCGTTDLVVSEAAKRVHDARKKHPTDGIDAAGLRKVTAIRRALGLEGGADPKAQPLTLAIDRVIKSAQSKAVSGTAATIATQLQDVQAQRARAAVLHETAQAKVDGLLAVVMPAAMERIRAHMPADLGDRLTLNLTEGGCSFALSEHPLSVASRGERTLIARAAALASLPDDSSSLMMLDDEDFTGLTREDETWMLERMSIETNPGGLLAQLIVFRQTDRADCIPAEFTRVVLAAESAGNSEPDELEIDL